MAAAAALSGCGGTNHDEGAPTGSTGMGTSQGGMFYGYPDLADLTAIGEIPPTELPDPGLFGAVLADSGIPDGIENAFDHIVVVMFENRSFDQLLGYLYKDDRSPHTKQVYNGVSTKIFSNPADGGDITYRPATSLQTPLIDPSEQWQSVNLALYNQFNPDSNKSVTSEDAFAAPYNLPPAGATFPPPLEGFVTMFAWTLRAAKMAPTAEALQTIMQGFTPSQVPVMSLLAQEFAVCDNWHCGVPSQTWPNRSFFHAASSSGLLNNEPYLDWIAGNTAPTIFDRLTEKQLGWAIYYDVRDVQTLTRLIHYPTLSKYDALLTTFGMSEFYDAVKLGLLPKYSFVQPRMLQDGNDYHPYNGAPAVKRGEILLNDIYTAIKASNSSTGSNYKNTLLIITFDEGGTCFDHAPPGKAVPPGDGYTGQLGFKFDRQGQRIPAILVSPWIRPGTVISTPLDATSVIATLTRQHGLQKLTDRSSTSTALQDVLAAKLSPNIDASGATVKPAARSREEMPTPRVRKLTAEEAATNLDSGLSDVQKGLVSLFHAASTGQEGMPAGVKTVRHALAYLKTSPPL